MDDFAGRTAFVTGGAQGIGLGIARALARQGASLALADINTDALATAEKELSRLTDVTTVELDVRDRDAYERAAVATEQRLGPVSLLVNNAGVAGAVAPARMTYESWDWVIGVNLHGVINGVQTFVPRMIDAGGGGYVVNTASGAGLVAGAAGSGFLYCTSKFAVVGMSEALHHELAHHAIGVSVLCPGPVTTGIIDHTDELRPAGSRTTSQARDRSDEARRFLAAGTSPDRAGEMVLDAVRAGRLYIHTDDYMAEPIRQRTETILAALPSVLG